MSHIFGPRKVAEGSWRKWSQQALGLQTRLKIANVAVSLLCLAYYMWLAQLNSLVLTVISMLVAAPVSLSIFVIIAAYADGKRILPAAKQRWKVFLRVLFLGLANWALLIMILASLFAVGYIVSLIFDLSIFANQATGSTELAPVKTGTVFTNPYLFLAALVYAIIPLAAWYAQSLVPYVSIWFVLLLILTTPLKIMDSYKMSLQAEKMNWQEINTLSMLALGLLSLILVSGGILAVIILPYLGSLLYVSFRDVFLGLSENAVIDVARSKSGVRDKPHLVSRIANSVNVGN